MNKLGKTVRSDGDFRVVEELAHYRDGTTSIVGYYVFGPAGKESPLLSEEHAALVFNDLVERSKASPPRFGR